MGDCVLGIRWGKEPPCMSPKVVIGAMGINGLIREHLPDWVSRGGPRGMASGSQSNYPSGMPRACNVGLPTWRR